jgi:hypothetical protein
MKLREVFEEQVEGISKPYLGFPVPCTETTVYGKDLKQTFAGHEESINYWGNDCYSATG